MWGVSVRSSLVENCMLLYICICICICVYIYNVHSIDSAIHQSSPSAHSLYSTLLTHSVRLVEFCTYSILNSIIHLVL